jgi:acyl CoA:acetate/3-ketoacid CoA transferase beta subunit
MTLTEIAEGYSVEDVQKATGCKLNISSELKPMRQA